MTDLDSLRAYVEAHRERLLAELAELCAIPSVAAEGRDLDEASAWVARRLAALGAEVEVGAVEGGAPVVLGSLGADPPGRTLLVYNHYDVQPADAADGWTNPPFAPAVRDGRLYGRGVADNKANLLSRIHAVEAWQATLGPLPLRLQWLIEGEEEVGSLHLPAFCDAYGARWAAADGCLWEAGAKDEHGRLVLYSGVKGIADFELRCRGANADKHSSLATVLPNPAWRLVWALATLKAPDETITIDGLAEHVVPPTAAERAAVAAIPYDDVRARETHGVAAFLTGVPGHEALLRHLALPPAFRGGGVPGPRPSYTERAPQVHVRRRGRS